MEIADINYTNFHGILEGSHKLIPIVKVLGGLGEILNRITSCRLFAAHKRSTVSFSGVKSISSITCTDIFFIN